jgi:drug/metabolite transporter (DMT)-like permease
LLLNKLQPVFAIILAYILLKEKIRKGFIKWAGIAIIASYFMTFGIALPNLGAGENLLQAALFSLLAAFSFGAATVFGKKVVKKYDFKTASFYRFFFTTIIMAIYVIFFSAFEFNSITTHNWLMIGIISVLIGIGSMFIYYFGLTRIKASRATMYELCFPISVVIFDYIFNNHLLTPVQLIAASIMIFAIVRISRLKNK